MDIDKLRAGERRSHPRYRVDLGAELLMGRGRERLQCLVRDISQCGAFLFWPARKLELAPATRFHFECVLPKPVEDTVRLEAEVVRQDENGFGVRLLNGSAASMNRLKAFLRHGAGGGKASARQVNLSATQRADEARGILHGLMGQRLPGMLKELQDTLQNRLWNACDTATSDAVRTALMDDIAVFSEAVREQRLLEPVCRELLSSRKFERNGPPGNQRDEEDQILELVDTERFEVWLANAALANRLDEQLREALNQIHRLAHAAFGPEYQFPLDPIRVATALENALSVLDLSAFSISFCLREASTGLGADLGDLYAELISAWQSAGIVPLPITQAATHGRRIAPPEKSAPDAASEPGTPTPEVAHPASPDAISDWLFSLPPNPEFETGIAPEVKEQLSDFLAPGFGPDAGRKVRMSERVGTTERMLANMMRDSHAPLGVKHLIKQLSTKFLALALRDAGFFRDASHPIVGIIDQLDHLSTLVPESGELRRLAEKTAASDVRDLDRLRSISAEIEALMDRYSSALQRNEERLVASLEGKERLSEARLQVSQRLNKTFAGQMMNIAAVRLIDEGWRTLLELVSLRQGFESPAWLGYWRTLLGVHCCTGGALPEGCDRPLECDELGASLRAGLDYLGFSPFQRGRLLSLINTAMESVYTQGFGENDFVEYPRIPPLEEAKATLIRRPRELSAEQWEHALECVDRLAVGSLLEQDLGGSKTGRRLIWRSRDGAQLVFADARGRNVSGLRRDQLAALLGQGEARVQTPSELGVTGRAMDATLDQIHEGMVHRQQLDPLTGLSTRNQLVVELTRCISAESDSEQQLAFGCLSPDHFEEMIGSSGYAAGDQLLKTIAERLKDSLPGAVCISYMGGSRFGFLVATPDGPSAHALGDEVRSALARSPFNWNGKPYPVVTSLGVTLVSADHGNPDVLLAAADTACTAARRAGGDRVILFRETDEAIAQQRAAVDGWIMAEEVVRSKRIRLRGQCITATDPAEAKPHHYEILLSVFDEAGEALSLMDFIRSAEAFHRMPDVDRLVVETALSWVHENPESAARLGGIAINLSGQSLRDESILDQICSTLQNLEIDPKTVGFEVTETAAIANLDRAVSIIEGIRAMGCRFALDDFGTGLSSYSYLKRLPVDYLKIDGSFVRDILTTPTDEAIVKSINEVAHFMGIKTIAEFVCEEPIRERLVEIGVDYVQGYAVEKPAYLEEVGLQRSA